MIRSTLSELMTMKREGSDRHGAGSGKITVEVAAVAEYLERTGQSQLDSARYRVSHDIEPEDPSRFVSIENDPDGYDRIRFADESDER
jgi:hypothetical protein